MSSSLVPERPFSSTCSRLEKAEVPRLPLCNAPQKRLIHPLTPTAAFWESADSFAAQSELQIPAQKLAGCDPWPKQGNKQQDFTFLSSQIYAEGSPKLPEQDLGDMQGEERSMIRYPFPLHRDTFGWPSQWWPPPSNFGTPFLRKPDRLPFRRKEKTVLFWQIWGN